MVFTTPIYNMFRWSFLILCIVVVSWFSMTGPIRLGLNSNKRNTDVSMIQVPQYDSDDYDNWLYNIIRKY